MKKKKLLLILSSAAFLIIAAAAGLFSYASKASVDFEGEKKSIFIPTGAYFQQVIDTINANIYIKDEKLFLWLVRYKKLESNIHAGRYVITNGMTYNSLINLLRSGKQSPVRITFTNMRTIGQIAGKFGSQLETDSLAITKFFDDTSNYSADGFNKATIISLFIPDTYEFYWNTSAPKLYERLLREYKSFWNNDRLAKAKQNNLSPAEVSTLASIIDEEVAKRDEKPKIAGVYINRLKQGIPLQADPTIKFVMNDFTLSRILKKYLEIESPYNTYIHGGLPPGPIGCPSKDGIEAVLNADKSDYLFFVAKPDFSGYHNFSRTLNEHNRFASLYQRELNRRRIFK